MTSEIPATLYEVLSTTCTIDQIQKLLRDTKERVGKDVRIGGDKEGVVANVRAAVDSGFIQEQAVIDLVRTHEESGNQHIFYFLPTNEESKAYLSDAQTIGQLLVGSRVSDGSLPNYQTKPKDYVWADFRTEMNGTIWTAKIYGHQVVKKFTGETEDAHKVVRTYEKSERRIVCLARWNGTELEYRIGRPGAGSAVDTGDSEHDKREVERRLEKLQEFLRPAKVADKIQSWELSPARLKMIRAVFKERDEGVKAKDSKLPYLVSHVSFLDSALGTAHFHSRSDREELANADDRGAAIQVYLAAKKPHCRQLVVYWDNNAVSDLWGKQPLRTVLGGQMPNEVIISSVVNSETVNYVTNQLRRSSPKTA